MTMLRLNDFQRDAVVSAVAGLIFGISALRSLSHQPKPFIDRDAAFFQHAGWYILQGGVPYREIWDVKPPLTYEFIAGLAFIAQGDMLILHYLSVLVTVLAGITVVFFSNRLIIELTNDNQAAIVGALMIMAFPGFHYLAGTGFRPKYLALVCGLGALVLLYENKPGLSGVLTVAAAGFWQFGLIFLPLTATGLIIQKEQTEIIRYMAGGGITTIIIITPILLLGVADEMVVEVILVPLLAGETVPFMIRIAKGIIQLSFLLPIVLIGVYGIIISMKKYKLNWWVWMGAIFAGIQVFFLDFDSYPDLFLGLIFVAVGVGIVFKRLQAEKRAILSIYMVFLIVISSIFLGGAGIVTEPVSQKTGELNNPDTLLESTVYSVGKQFGYTDNESQKRISQNSPSPYGKDWMKKIYWKKVRPKSCHYRLSPLELIWIKEQNLPINSSSCGEWPFS